MIEIRFQFPDPRRRLAAVRLAHELRDRLPYELTPRGASWELTAPAPDVARFEYQFELIDRRGRSEWVLDPDNPKTASGPWGDKSVWEEPGYEPPAWLAAEPAGKAKAVTIPSRILKAELPALVWAHPDATESSPMLVAHDGPEYAEHSSLLTLLERAAAAPRDPDRPGRPQRDVLGERPLLPCARRRDPARTPLCAGPHRPRRKPRRARALPCAPPLSGHLRRAVSPVGQLLPARRVVRAQLPALRADRAVRRRHPPQPARAHDPGRARLRDGRGESRRRTGHSRSRSRTRGYDVRLHEFRDGHNWVAWRDSFQPQLAAAA